MKKRGGKVIVVGEVRHPHVAAALLDAQASGHAGMSTFHVHSPQEAIYYRLQQLLLRTGSFPSLVTAKMELYYAEMLTRREGALFYGQVGFGANPP